MTAELADDYDGAPVYGFVSDPAATSGPGLPQYRPTYIYACPECMGDLQHEGGAGYWCSACCRSFGFAEVGCFDETDWERD